MLRGQGTFAQWNHYPKGDVHDGETHGYDRETHGQYYYRAHPSDLRGGEHGHFHTFVRAAGMPESMQPARLPAALKRPLGDKALGHLIGISMDKRGHPIRLFTVDRWVTGESWYAAGDAIALLDRFAITHAVPGWPVNRWIGAMVRLFRPQIEWLAARTRRRGAGVAGRQSGLRDAGVGRPQARGDVGARHFGRGADPAGAGGGRTVNRAGSWNRRPPPKRSD